MALSSRMSVTRVRVTHDDAIDVEHGFGESRVHERAAERVRIEEMIHVIAGVAARAPRLRATRRACRDRKC